MMDEMEYVVVLFKYTENQFLPIYEADILSQNGILCNDIWDYNFCF